MNELTESLTAAARRVLLTPQPLVKAEAAQTLSDAWHAGQINAIGIETMPDRPGRPARPELLPPRQMPRRRKAGAIGNRIALLHAVAHIELNAIDLAVDIAGRFGPEHGDEFIGGWLLVAADESRHFKLLEQRLQDLGGNYGDLPAHDGLWEAAEQTQGDICDRLAVAHTVLEARGLDVTPAMIERMQRHGDQQSAEILSIILSDEVGHVRLGMEWFQRLAIQRGHEPEDYWRQRVAASFRGKLKRPFNRTARDLAGMPASFYEPLAD